MCEYCGCQAVQAIEELTREHDAALDHVRVARQAVASGDGELAARTCAALSGLLRPHTAVEEQGLFPAMARDFGEQVELLHTEHVLVHGVLDDVARDGARAEAWRSRLLGALSVLRLHILKEQDGVFPAALSTLTPADWDALDAVREEVGRGLAVLEG